MKHHHSQDPSPAGRRLVPVHFESADSVATRVQIAGTFNGCRPAGKAMDPSINVHWHKETALMPGIYKYRLVVDGRGMADPLAKDYVPNAFGGRNSVVIVKAHQKLPASEGISLLHKKTHKQKTENI